MNLLFAKDNGHTVLAPIPMFTCTVLSIPYMNSVFSKDSSHILLVPIPMTSFSITPIKFTST